MRLWGVVFNNTYYYLNKKQKLQHKTKKKISQGQINKPKSLSYFWSISYESWQEIS